MTLADIDVQAFLTYDGSRTIRSNGMRSLGGLMTDVELVSYFDPQREGDNRHNLFGQVEPEHTVSGVTTYRCLAIKNNSSDTSMVGLKVWVEDSNGLGTGTTIELLVETPGADSNVQQIGGESEVPTGTFDEGVAVSKATGLVLTSETGAAGEIKFGEWAAVWIKRTIVADRRADVEGIVLRVEGGEAAKTYFVGKSVSLTWWVVDAYAQEILEKLNDLPQEYIHLRTILQHYEDAVRLLGPVTGASATQDDIDMAITNRCAYTLYVAFLNEMTRKTGKSMPPTSTARMYELRRLSNESMGYVNRTATGVTRKAVVGRGPRSRYSSNQLW